MENKQKTPVTIVSETREKTFMRVMAAMNAYNRKVGYTQGLRLLHTCFFASITEVKEAYDEIAPSERPHWIRPFLMAVSDVTDTLVASRLILAAAWLKQPEVLMTVPESVETAQPLDRLKTVTQPGALYGEISLIVLSDFVKSIRCEVGSRDTVLRVKRTHSGSVPIVPQTVPVQVDEPYSGVAQATSRPQRLDTPRRGDIPISTGLHNSPRVAQAHPGVGFFNTIGLSKRIATALYKIREKSGRAPCKEARVGTVRKARSNKLTRFHELTGMVPQVGFNLNFTHGVQPEVAELLTNLTGRFQDAISGVGNNLQETLGGVRSCIGDFTQTLEGMGGNLSSVVNTASTGATGLFDLALNKLMHALWVLPLIGACYYAVTEVAHFNTPQVCYMIASLLAILLPGGLWDLIKDLWPKKKEDEFSDSREEFEGQFGGFEPSSLGHIISLALTFLTIGKTDPIGIATGFIKNMGTYGRSVDSWTKLSTFVLDIVEQFVNYIRKQFGATSISLYRSGVEAVDSWCTRVMAVLNLSQTGGEVMTPEVVQQIISLRNEGTDLTNLYRISKDVTVILHKYLAMLDNLCKLCSSAMHAFKGGRPQPIVMGITGAPGVGKTYLCTLITNMVIGGILPPERCAELDFDFSSQVFQKGSTEYWNGYAGQKAVIVDDWAQNVPVAGGENDFIDLIRMANCWAYPLNFADLENKGKNFFRSDFILLTTNIVNLNSASAVIVEPAAVTRRIDYGYSVTVSPDFSLNGKIDLLKVREHVVNGGDFPYHAWEFRKHKFAVGAEAITDMSCVYNLKDILAEIVSTIKRNKVMHEDNVSMIRRVVKAQYAPKTTVPIVGNELVVHGPSNSVREQINSMIPILVHSSKALRGDCILKPPMPNAVEFMRKYMPVVPSALPSKGEIQIEPQAGIFERYGDYLKRCVVGCLDLRVMNKEFFEILDEIVEMPLIAFLLSTASIAIIFFIGKQIFNSVVSWFHKPVTKDKEIQKSLRRKGKVDSALLAQALDSLRPSDFEETVEVEGTFEVKRSFTANVLKRAYERLMGKPLEQSNEPVVTSLPRRVVTSRKVVESDIAYQGDLYGSEIADVSARNVYQFRAESPLGFQTFGQVLFIQDTCALLPVHFDRQLRHGVDEGVFELTDKVILINVFNPAVKVSYPIADYLQFERAASVDDDCQIVKFVCLRAHKDIRSFFVRESDLTSLSKVRVRLDTVEGRGDQFVQRVRHMEARRRDRVEVSKDKDPYTLAMGYEYLGYTKAGDCGGVVNLEEAPHLQCRRIIGIHVAGQPSMGIGICNIMTSEKIDMLMKRFNVIEDLDYQSHLEFQCIDAPVEGAFLGLRHNKVAHALNPVTSLTKTPMYGCLGPLDKVPAHQGRFKNAEGEWVNPMAIAVGKYGSPLQYYAQEDVDRAAHHAFSKLRDVTVQHDRRLHTFEEAVAGVPGTNIKGIPRGTSPGYPYVLQGHTSKKKFFGSSDVYTFDSQEARDLKIEVERILSLAKDNKRTTHVFVDFLKDELRPSVKVEAGGTRLISSAPLAYTIAFRMMFLGFTSAVQDTRIRNGVAVGINPYSEWDYVAKGMQSKGPHCVAGDFKGFDSSEQPQIFWAILDQINAWYDDGPENARIRRVLWLEVLHSRHLGGTRGKCDTVYQWVKSLPSGHPMTSIINSFYNLIIFNMVWVDLMGVHMASSFWLHVFILTYGDDNILNISPLVIGKFNQCTIEAAMLKRYMIYTTETKGASVLSSRPLSDVGFLKRGFRKDPLLDSFVGPQELDSILYLSYWCKNKKMLDDIVRTNVEQTWLELSLHGDSVWDEWAPLLREAYKDRLGEHPQELFTRKEYLRKVVTMDLPWL